MNGEEMRAALIAAFDKLEVLGPPAKLEAIINGLLAIGSAPVLDDHEREVTLRSFREVGSRQTRAELNRLFRAAEKLGNAIEALHQPAILALADAGCCPDRKSITSALRKLAGKAHDATAYVKNREPNLSHRRDRRALVVARIIVDRYEELFGRRTDLPGQSPGLAGLIKDVFAVIGVPGNHVAALQAVLKEREESDVLKEVI
jgi:hypothetical protein